MEQVKLFLCGDVMLARGIDQILPFPSNPELHEAFIHDAKDYVVLAEKRFGSIPKPVNFEYVWGESLQIFEQANLNFRIINLETSITTSNQWLSKGINYRMHPKNIVVLTAAKIDGCTIANNHILDWDKLGLFETLESLEKIGIKAAGAGKNLSEAMAPIIFKINKDSRLLFFSVGTYDSGIPESWAAKLNLPGVNSIPNLSNDSIMHIKNMIQIYKKSGDIVILSIHWGSNWGYSIPDDQRKFSRALIDEGVVDLIHGHSSHHVKGIEVYHNKLILYGCGDLLTDYEGIHGYEEFRSDLSFLYFSTLNVSNGNLINLELIPMQTKGFQLHKAKQEETKWLVATLNREGRRFNTQIVIDKEDKLTLNW